MLWNSVLPNAFWRKYLIVWNILHVLIQKWMVNVLMLITTCATKLSIIKRYLVKRYLRTIKDVIYFFRCMNSVGVFGKGFDILFGEESLFRAKSSISSNIVSTSKCDVFLDSFLLALREVTDPVTTFLFSTPLLLLSSCSCLASSSTSLTELEMGSMIRSGIQL